MPQMGIQPEKEWEREGEREREEVNMGGTRFPRNQFKKLARETDPSFIVQKTFYTFWLYIEING